MSSSSVNPTVLLIGASRGLGYAMAAEYVERGSQVVVAVRSPTRTALHELHDTRLAAVGGAGLAAVSLAQLLRFTPEAPAPAADEESVEETDAA